MWAAARSLSPEDMAAIAAAARSRNGRSDDHRDASAQASLDARNLPPDPVCGQFTDSGEIFLTPATDRTESSRHARRPPPGRGRRLFPATSTRFANARSLWSRSGMARASASARSRSPDSPIVSATSRSANPRSTTRAMELASASARLKFPAAAHAAGRSGGRLPLRWVRLVFVTARASREVRSGSSAAADQLLGGGNIGEGDRVPATGIEHAIREGQSKARSTIRSTSPLTASNRK